MSGTRLDMGERIYRYEVPVDDEWHPIQLWGNPLAVACRDPRVVEFWARHSDGPIHGGRPRAFVVVGTGHIISVGTRYWGTVIAPGGSLVWHLLEQWPS